MRPIHDATLFLQAPSFEGFDGGAGSRYQAWREIRSFWYPTWLAQPAALVENSKLIDAPPRRFRLAQIAANARDYDLAVLHTSAPSFASDVEAVKALKAVNPALKAGRQSRRRFGRQSQSRAGHRLRRPQRVRFHDQGSRGGAPLERYRRLILP